MATKEPKKPAGKKPEGKKKRESVRKELERLDSLRGGKITADEVVAAARKADSPLHNEFEWDDKKAGHQYRLDQARALIRTIRVEHRVEERIVKAVVYVRDPDVEPNEQGYVRLATLVGDQERQRRLVRQELERISGSMKRLAEIKEVLQFRDKIDAMVEELEVIKVNFAGRVVEETEDADAEESVG